MSTKRTPEQQRRNNEATKAWLARKIKADPSYIEKRKVYLKDYHAKHLDDPGRRERRQEKAAIWQKAARRSAEKWGRVKIPELRLKARKKGLPFNIDANDLVVPSVCPVLGTPFVFGKVAHPQCPSVDRIIPELGYVKGNVAVISLRANTLKRDCSDPKELRAVADYIERRLSRD